MWGRGSLLCQQLPQGLPVCLQLEVSLLSVLLHWWPLRPLPRECSDCFLSLHLSHKQLLCTGPGLE